MPFWRQSFSSENMMGFLSLHKRGTFLRLTTDIIIIKGWSSLNVCVNLRNSVLGVFPKNICVCVMVVVWRYTHWALEEGVWVQVCGSDQVWGQSTINPRKQVRPPTPLAHHTTTVNESNPTTPQRHGNTHIVTLNAQPVVFIIQIHVACIIEPGWLWMTPRQ